MVKVIRKRDIFNNNVISKEPVLRTFAVGRTRSALLADPIAAIKKSIKVKIDKYGNPDIESTLDLGVAYDHRVTWLEFDLDDLLWNTEAKINDDYKDENRYSRYLFKLAFKNTSTDETQIYEFDGKTFYIPRGVTAPVSSQDEETHLISEKINYRMLLIIQELQQDDPEDYGNVKGVVETFISKEWNAVVKPSAYRPGALSEEEVSKTYQLHSLTKPPVLCKLSDIGMFGVDRTVLGNNQDNTIAYFKFDPTNTTAHLEGFNVFMCFEKDDIVIYRQ